MFKSILGIFLTVQQPQPKPHFAVEIKIKTEADLSSIKGRKMANLNAMYLGFSGEAPAYKQIDFAKNLDKLWHRKLAIEGVSKATEKSYKIFLERYRHDPGFTTLEDYRTDIRLSITEAKRSINWGKVCKRMKVKDCYNFVLAAYSINENHILAYSMTEIFPSQDGEFNKNLLNVLLNEAGTTFINGIPALGDTFLSVGPYQFTSYAIRSDGNTEGANVIEKYSKLKIPGSVAKLEGNDHHIAAYYFAVYNLGRLARKTNIKSKCMGDSMVPFISTAHHLPTVAINRAESWIAGGCNQRLEDYLGPKLNLYAKKTRINLKAVDI